MENLGKIIKVSPFSAGKNNSGKPVKVKVEHNKYLHSPAHLLADELSARFNDKKHFGFYLKMASMYDHNLLRKLLGQVLESKNVKSPGKLFAYLIKKHNVEEKNRDQKSED